MYNKFGQKIRPYEYTVDMIQTGEYSYPIDFDPELYKIEYIYSMKNFQSGEIVYEREPHRVLHIQDPMHYRGQLAYKKSNAQPETHKVFIVNGKIEKVDGNFQGGFFFNKIKNDSGIILGTYPLTPNDVLKMKKSGVNAVLNIMTGKEMLSRGIDWDEMKEQYKDVGIERCMSFPVCDSTEEKYLEDLFDAAQHLNQLLCEEEHTVYIHCGSSITRGPTLALSYLCLFVKLRTYSNLTEANRLLKQYHQVAMPNLTIVKKLLKNNKLFQIRQKMMIQELDNDYGIEVKEESDEEGLFITNKKLYHKHPTKEDIKMEGYYIFGQEFAPMPFDAFNEDGKIVSHLDGKILEIVEKYKVTVPILHIANREYLIGTQRLVLTLEKDNEVYVLFQESTQKLDKFIVDNHKKYEEAIIYQMINGAKSLEEVCDDNINKSVAKRRAIIHTEHDHKLKDTNWLSIDVSKRHPGSNVKERNDPGNRLVKDQTSTLTSVYAPSPKRKYERVNYMTRKEAETDASSPEYKPAV